MTGPQELYGVRHILGQLPDHFDRCDGVQYDEGDWREGCETCVRRTSPRHGPFVPPMTPPPVIAFFCPFLIEPGEA